MPLAFESTSHGTIAFGFFNIESDMLLLERYFFFATDFCDRICAVAQAEGGRRVQTSWPAIEIPKVENIGDLMGAIHGVRYTGFIGETYRKFPFPRDHRDFKQNPAGEKNREYFDERAAGYGHRIELSLAIGDAQEKKAAIGEYEFDVAVFRDLLRYVWRGGYPRWKDETRPACVQVMKSRLENSSFWLFDHFDIATS